jgi:hypothetical protein
MILEINIKKEGSSHSETFKVDTQFSEWSFWVAHLDIDLHLSASFLENIMSFADELKGLINKHSEENTSNTPDWILAQYLESCLAAFNQATQQTCVQGKDNNPVERKCDNDGTPLT